MGNSFKYRDRENSLKITTPEGVSFSFTIASPVSRCAALALDLACILAMVTAVNSCLRFFALVSVDLSYAISVFLYFITSFGYGIMLEWIWNGQTVGKRILGLRVIDGGGMRLRFPQVVIRNLMRAIDSMPFFYFVGGLASTISPLHQRFGDYVAQTIVVKLAKTGSPDLSKILPDKYNSFRDYPQIIGILRAKLPVEFTALIMNSLLRRDALDPRIRNEIYVGMAEFIQRTAKFPPEAVEGISDEKYLRNIIDTMLNRMPQG